MTYRELRLRYKNESTDQGGAFYPWEEKIIERIREAVKNDEEALAFLEHILYYVRTTSVGAGLGD
jgi:hypothetical protein